MVRKKEMLFADFPKMREITSNVKEQNKKRTFTGGVRINMGMYRTDEEMKKYIKDSLSREMP